MPPSAIGFIGELNQLHRLSGGLLGCAEPLRFSSSFQNIFLLRMHRASVLPVLLIRPEGPANANSKYFEQDSVFSFIWSLVSRANPVKNAVRSLRHPSVTINILKILKLLAMTQMTPLTRLLYRLWVCS
jgi:hypothetical protein